MNIGKAILATFAVACLSITLSFGQKKGDAEYITITAIQGKFQTEVLVHKGGDKFEDKVIRTSDQKSDEVTPEREQEYNGVIDMINKYAKQGYEVVNMSVSMAGHDSYHPYTVYLLRKDKF